MERTRCPRDPPHRADLRRPRLGGDVWAVSGDRRGDEVRANKVPVIDRLKLRIDALLGRIEASHVPIGDGNPYWHCAHCGMTDPQASVAGREHYVGCPIDGLRKQMAHFERLMARAIEAGMTPAERRWWNS